MPTTIRTREARELLALLPFQLGFHPRESAVLVCLQGGRARVGLVVRADLAELAEPGHGRRLARSLVQHLLADGARRAVVVLYTDEDLQAGRDDGPAAAAARTLLGAAEPHLGDVECWVVGPRGYYALGCADAGCCPSGGRPLAELESTQVGAQMVLEGVRVAARREDLVVLPAVAPVARKAARRARSRWQARGDAAGAGADLHRWRRDGLRQWHEALAGAMARAAAAASAGATSGVRALTPVTFGAGGPLLAAAPTGRLLAALDDVLVRDAVLVSFVAGHDRLAERIVAGEQGVAIGAALGTILDPARGRRPERGRATAAREVLEHVVAHAPWAAHAPGLTLLAVLAWWEGDGARAGVLVDRALAADADYRLAVLVDQALRAGMPPGWAARAG